MRRNTWQHIILLIILSASMLIGMNGCGGGTTPTSTSQSEEGNDIKVTSSVSESHTHDVTIPWTDVEDANRTSTYTSTENGATPHTHSVIVSAQNLAAVKQGKTVTVTSGIPKAAGIGVVSNHTHQFVIKK